MTGRDPSLTTITTPSEVVPQAAREVTITGIFSAVTQYYDLTETQLTATGSHELEVRDARAVTFTTMARHAGMSIDTIAQIMSTSNHSVSQILKRLELQAAEDPKLQAHIEEVALAASGEKPIADPAEWLELAANHYNVPVEDIGVRMEPRAIHARQLSGYLLVENTALRKGAIARRIGYHSSDALALAVESVYEKSRKDPDFAMDLSNLEQGMLPEGRAENRGFIADRAERKEAADRLMKKVCDFYGVKVAEVLAPGISNRFIRPRRVTAYLLMEELGLPIYELTEQLQRSRRTTMLEAHREIQQEIAANPGFAAEMAYLKKAGNITRSINKRIMYRVAATTGLDVDTIMEGKGPEGIQARQMAMVLMAERGHLSSPEVAKFFGLSTEGAVYRAQKLIAHHQADDTLLVQQLQWVRKGLLYNRPKDSFVFDDTQAGQAGASSGEEYSVTKLPDIDENLVYPEIREKIYDIVEETAGFYGVPAIEVVGRSEDFMVNRARKAAILRCRQARLPLVEIGLCFDARRHTSLASTIRKTEAEAEQYPVFAEELEALDRGKPRREVLNETLQLVCHYYGVSWPELCSGKDNRAVRARAVFLAVMTEHASESREDLATAANRSLAVTTEIILRTAKRLQTDPRLKAEVKYLKDPLQALKPPDAKDILRKVRQTSGVSDQELLKPTTPEGYYAQRMAIYILADELALSNADIAKILRCNKDKVGRYLQQTEEELAKHPSKVLEIDKLRPANAASFSLTAKIMQFTTQRHGVRMTDLLSQDSSLQLNRARLEAAGLLLSRAGYSSAQAASLLGIPASIVESMVQTKTNHSNGNGAASSPKL